MKVDPESEATLKNTIDLLDRLVAFDTTSSRSNLQLIEFVTEYLGQRGLNARLTSNSEGTKSNLWVTIGPESKGGVVLSGHTDVVPVDGQQWISDPFQLDERNGKLYGRGTCDMKGFLACVLAHTDYFLSLPLQVPVHYALSYDEEVGCIGVGGLIRDIVDNLPLPIAVIVGEPTSMKIIGGNKGGRSFDTTINGTDGHSSLPQLGVNSILVANQIIEKLTDVQERLIREADPDNGFNPPYTTLDIGVINGGTAANIIPARCDIKWGFRGLPDQDMDKLESEIRSFIDDEIVPDMQAVSSDTGVVTIVRSDVPPLQPDENSTAEQLVRHLSKLNESGRVSYGTEAGLFQKAGIPGVIYGPGSIEQAHLPDEYVEVSQLDECNRFLAELGQWATNPVFQ